MRFGLIHVVLTVLFFLGGSSSVWSLPEFDLQFGSRIYPEEGHDHGHGQDQPIKTFDCRACHINPTGGGMRNEHGRKFAVEHLPMMDTTDAMKKSAASAQITEQLSFGTDVRLAYLLTEQETTSRFKNSFFPMQADLYIAFTPTDYLTFYYQDGVELAGSREAFVLLTQLPFNGHLKAGRFTPPFGLKLDDHSTFIREKLEFGPDHSFGQDSGLEVGFGGNRLFANAAIFNGSPFGGVGSSDDNTRKGFSATGGWKSPRLWLAGSVYTNESEREDKTYAGGYGGFHFWRVTVLGEWDHVALDDLTTGTDDSGFVLLGEVVLHVMKGANAMVRYERCEDDDMKICIDDDELQRLTIGINLYPAPFTELIFQFRKNTENTEVDNDRFLVMLHMFY